MCSSLISFRVCPEIAVPYFLFFVGHSVEPARILLDVPGFIGKYLPDIWWQCIYKGLPEFSGSA